MSLWNRVFTGKRARRQLEDLPATQAPTKASAGQPTCPFCGGEAVEQSLSKTGYPLWESECGATGSGSSMYPDLDEVADGLLATLGLPGTVSEPSVPAGRSGVVSMQHYDIPKSLDHLREIMRTHGFEMQMATHEESGHSIHTIWVRRRIA